MKKTYGVYGKREYIVTVTLGQQNFQIHFEHGRTNNYGLVPASYSTNNPVIQLAIENSLYYSGGVIKLIKETREAIDIEIEKERAAKATGPQTPEAGASERDGVEGETEGETSALVEVKVACVADAQQYLSEHFNIPAYKAKSREKANILGEAYGVKFIWE